MAMIPTATLHATLVFEREIPAPVEEVFAAFADPVARTEWGAPSDTAVVIYDEADFREGGQDRFRCGSKADLALEDQSRVKRRQCHRCAPFRQEGPVPVRKPGGIVTAWAGSRAQLLHQRVGNLE